MTAFPVTAAEEGKGGGWAVVGDGAIPTGGMGNVQGIGGRGFWLWAPLKEPPISKDIWYYLWVSLNQITYKNKNKTFQILITYLHLEQMVAKEEVYAA